MLKAVGEKGGLEAGPGPQTPRKMAKPPGVRLKVPRTVCNSRWHHLSTCLGLPTCCEQLPEIKKGVPPQTPATKQPLG